MSGCSTGQVEVSYRTDRTLYGELRSRNRNTPEQTEHFMDDYLRDRLKQIYSTATAPWMHRYTRRVGCCMVVADGSAAFQRTAAPPFLRFVSAGR